MQGIVRRLRRLSDVIATFGAANATFGAAKFEFRFEFRTTNCSASVVV